MNILDIESTSQENPGKAPELRAESLRTFEGFVRGPCE